MTAVSCDGPAMVVIVAMIVVTAMAPGSTAAYPRKNADVFETATDARKSPGSAALAGRHRR